MKQKPFYRVALILAGTVVIALFLAGFANRGAGQEARTVAALQDKPAPQPAQSDNSQLPQELVDRVGGGKEGKTSPGNDSAGSDADYVRLVDSYGAITLDVPRAWSQIDMGTWNIQGKPAGRFIAASTDLAAFFNSGNVPGVMFGATSSMPADYESMVLGTDQAMSAKGCNDRGLLDYHDPFNQGNSNYFIDCPGGSPNLLVLTTQAPSKGAVSILRISIKDKADLDGARRILSTFQVIGDVDKDNHHSH